MEYFTEQALTYPEANVKIRNKYGERAKILTKRSIRIGGFLGMFKREAVEVTGYLSQEPVKRVNVGNFDEEKQKILSQVKNDQTMKQVLDEVQELRKFIQDGPAARTVQEPETINKLEDILADNDFTPKYIRDIKKRLISTLTYEELEDWEKVESQALQWISDSIQVEDEGIQSSIFILVGPTGVGKTTTIAKLAAMYGISASHGIKREVRILTIDNYRIGARQQIETYGEIMGIPVQSAESYQELDKKIQLFSDTDLILIDTIGKSPNDFVKLAEMREILQAAGRKAETYLALSASTKSSDIKEILSQFEPFHYSGIVLTKLDETMRVGNLISILSSSGKPIKYITDGQMVPQDIERASKERILKQLEGFNVRKNRLNMAGSREI
jgi:flagellar biosynthesis protein FlhF